MVLQQREFWLQAIQVQRTGLIHCLPVGLQHFPMLLKLMVVWVLLCLHGPLPMVLLLQAQFLLSAHHHPRLSPSHTCRYPDNKVGKVSRSKQVMLCNHPSCLRLQCSNSDLPRTCHHLPHRPPKFLKDLSHLPWECPNCPVGDHHLRLSKGLPLCSRDQCLPLRIISSRHLLLQVDSTI